MKLFYKPGACSMASHISLREMGVEFTLEEVDTEAGRTASGLDFSTINPNGYVPALDLGDGQIATENSALLQYLSDIDDGKSLMTPLDSKQRLRQQELLSFLSSELHKAFAPFFQNPGMNEEERGRAETKLGRRIDHVEGILNDGREFLMGETFGVVDAYAFVVLNWSRFVGIDMAPWPRCRAFVDRVANRPSVQAAMRAEGILDQ